jgi:uncharacterized protein (DUF1499 family)
MTPIDLPPCPSSPNCVSTQATDSVHGIAPIPYTATAPEAMQQLAAIIEAMPRTTITMRDDTSIRAQFRTRFFRFVDDVIFVIDDEAKQIHFHSASRLGYRDFGVNRNRMESIRQKFGESRHDAA